jgi:hypothetical protein
MKNQSQERNHHRDTEDTGEKFVLSVLSAVWSPEAVCRRQQASERKTTAQLETQLRFAAGKKQLWGERPRVRASVVNAFF